MNDLDEKLEQAFIEAGIVNGEQIPEAHVLRTRLMPFVKKAFKDAGWEAPIDYNKPSKQMFGEPVPLDFNKQISLIPINVMTGQEWYDRFWGELTKTPAKTLAKRPGLILDYVDLVAKKAAGIK